MLLLNKFMHICQRFMIANNSEKYEFLSGGNLDHDKFSVTKNCAPKAAPFRHIVIGPSIWINYNNFIAFHLHPDMLYATMILFLNNTEFIETIKCMAEILYPKTAVVRCKNYYPIKFNLNSYLSWLRYKKGPLYRKKLLEWI